MRIGRSLVAVFVAWLSLSQASPAQQTPKPDAPANADALVLKDFKERVDTYIALRNKAAKDAPPLKETPNPAVIKSTQDTIADRIRAARSTAQPGELFTPAVRDLFRKLLRPELKGEEGRDAKQVLKDDAPEAVPLKVNAKYPDKAPLPTVPAKLLLNLPTLPKEFEYRIIGRHLILRDVEADIIVDYMLHAIK